MDGVHDLGGFEGLGPINAEPEAEEPTFHAEWERRALAVTLASAMLGRWNLDISRHARERQHPVAYLSNSYYENWLAGLETLLVESGLLTAEELSAGKALSAPTDPDTIDPPGPEKAIAIVGKGADTAMQTGQQPRFQIGDGVRVRNLHPSGHIRAPRYTRDRVGEVFAYHGVHVFADRNAHGEHVGEPLYGVRFTARELWGADGDAMQNVAVDLWEPHLEPA